MALKRLACFTLSAVAVSFGIVSAHAGTELPAYWTDSEGKVVRNGQDLCWRTNYWTPSTAIEACDPDIVRQRIAAATPPRPMAPVPAPVVPAPAPIAPVAVAPIAAPAVAAPAPALRREKIALSADTLFAFGRAALRPTAIEKLDELVGKLKGVDPESIQVTGHTDRLGSFAYNQRLSLQRAESIKTYLVAKGVAPSDIKVAGKGELESVTKRNECSGAKSPKLIACLQPDRRVDIELVGTRLR